MSNLADRITYAFVDWLDVEQEERARTDAGFPVQQRLELPVSDDWAGIREASDSDDIATCRRLLEEADPATLEKDDFFAGKVLYCALKIAAGRRAERARLRASQESGVLGGPEPVNITEVREVVSGNIGAYVHRRQFPEYVANSLRVIEDLAARQQARGDFMPSQDIRVAPTESDALMIEATQDYTLVLRLAVGHLGMVAAFRDNDMTRAPFGVADGWPDMYYPLANPAAA